MKRRWVRAIPAVIVAALLMAAGIASSLRASSRAPQLEDSATSCDLIIQQGTGTVQWSINPFAGVTQPILPSVNIQACSVRVSAYYSQSRVDILQWNPVTLTADPTTIALRSRAFNPSELATFRTRANFFPPVVVKSLPHLAETPRATVAMDWVASDNYNANQVYINPDDESTAPAAYSHTAGGPPLPFAGGHPVLTHRVCGGDATVQSLSVAQAVMTTNALSDTSRFDLMQRFRVPQRTTLHWVEVAFGVAPEPVYYDPLIAIYDAQGQAVPPTTLPQSLVEAGYQQTVTRPGWASHFDFDHFITLEPGRDYWLLARVEHRYVLYARTLTGAEGPDFTSRIGPYFVRNTLTGAWSQVPGQALCFRLIGEPNTSNVDAPEPRRSFSGLHLTVTPNPSRGMVQLAWSGARGPVRVEVLDAHGRRVVSRAGLGGSEGRFSWDGARDAGGLLPAGVYFARGSDGVSPTAIERVVLVR